MNDMVVDVSPRICADHYVVTPEIATQFTAWPEACTVDGHLVHLDLQKVAQAQLEQSGVVPKNIGFAPVCTFENTKYFSYRRDRPEYPQVQLGWIAQQ
jgi:copper oxidase (laccase) domain-containing protein